MNLKARKKTLSSRGLLVVPEADELVFTDLLRAMPPPPPPSPSRLNERLTRGLRMLQLVSSSWILGQLIKREL